MDFTYTIMHANRSQVQIINAGITNVDRPIITSLFDLYFLRKESWEYPIYTLLLGLQTMNCDLLSLGGYGNELNILENLPFHKVTIDILAIHLTRDKHPNIDKYGRLIEDFLSLQSYNFLQK
uniref:Uncharacterized protein n=1 Tax=Megaselia scalaris TaxID=36166 RepID=T1GWS1_MEGSC